MKKRWILSALSAILLLGLFGCGQKQEEETATVCNTFAQTSLEKGQDAQAAQPQREGPVGQTPLGQMEEPEEIIMKTYYEMSDGTWKTDDYSYRYKLMLTGRLHNAAKDTTYTILSNTKDITFDQAWKASGLSSHSEDYFDEEDAVFVAIQ